jgi:hypothetical protein
LNKGLTYATFNWSGKMDVSINLLIKDVIGPVTTGFGFSFRPWVSNRPFKNYRRLEEGPG